MIVAVYPIKQVINTPLTITNGNLQERLLSKQDDNLSVEEHWTHFKTEKKQSVSKPNVTKIGSMKRTKRSNDTYEYKFQDLTHWQNTAIATSGELNTIECVPMSKDRFVPPRTTGGLSMLL